MTRRGFREFVRSLLCFLVATVLVLPVALQADQAQYFYDELGRLVGVVDGQGNAAVYNYDEVGNLLSIQRFTSSTIGIGIFVVAPNSARMGTNVTIQGFGFSATPSQNQVAFNGTAAPVVSATTTSIVATVPTGATTGPVTVTNANGTATSPTSFTVLIPPIITGVDPPAVPRGVTSRVRIEGFNLKSASAVQFSASGLSATIVPGATESTMSINLTVEGSVAPGTYPFSVTTPAGTAQSGTVAVRVEPAKPTSGMGKLSIFVPLPATLPPTGPTSSVGNVSVGMP